MVTINLMEEDVDLIHQLHCFLPIFTQEELDKLDLLLIDILEQSEWFNQPKDEKNSR